jgi:aminopeptidase N
MRLRPGLFVLAIASLLSLGCSDDPDASASGAGGGSSSSSGAAGGDAGGSAPAGLIDGKVRRYDYAFYLAAGSGRSTLAIDVPPPGGDCFAASLEISSALDPTWNGQPALSSTVEGGALTLCGPGVSGGEALSVASSATLKEKVYLGLDVGFSRSTDMANGKFSYLLSWVGGCDRFGPCDDDPAELAEFHFEVTHPQDTVVLCPGVLTPGETLTQCDIKGTLAPTYSAFAIAADPLWARADFGTAAGVDLVFYEVPGGGLAAALDQASVLEFMTWVTDLLGPFPYGDELRIAGGPTIWLGFEHPANIILQEDLPTLKGAYTDPTMHVLMHEIIHQWAGDRTTLAEAPDFVWKEATAEYLAYVFEDEHRPPGEAAETRAYWDDISQDVDHYPRPMDNPPPEVQNFYGDVYGPGPMVLYLQLEPLIGRPAVLAGIKAFLAEPGALGVEALRAALESASGQILKPYFDAWVFGSGAPERPSFKVATSQAGGEVTVTVTQENASGKVYGCAVEVEVLSASSKARVIVDFGLAPSSKAATAKVALAEPALGYSLDPDHRVIGDDITVMPAAAPPPRKKRPVWIF